MISITQFFSLSLLYIYFRPMFYDYGDNYHHQLFISAVNFGSTCLLHLKHFYYVNIVAI